MANKCSKKWIIASQICTIISFVIAIILIILIFKFDTDYDNYKESIYVTYCKNILEGTEQMVQIDTSGLYNYPEYINIDTWFDYDLNQEYICFYNPCSDMEITGYLLSDRTYIMCNDNIRTYPEISTTIYDKTIIYVLLIIFVIFFITSISCCFGVIMCEMNNCFVSIDEFLKRIKMTVSGSNFKISLNGSEYGSI